MAFRHDLTGDDPHAGKWEIEAEVLHETPKALKLRWNGQTHWVPRADATVLATAGARATLVVPHWKFREMCREQVRREQAALEAAVAVERAKIAAGRGAA